MDLRAAIVELLENGVSDRAADAAADHTDLLLALGLGGLAERTDEVLDRLALGFVAELFRGRADGLDNDGDRALLAVVIVDGDGDALAVFIHTQNDELTGLRLLRHHRRLDLVQDHRRFQGFFSYDFVHAVSSFLFKMLFVDNHDRSLPGKPHCSNIKI